ncbi:TetR family transcriptional regulator [Kutzneria viridogrisea]|uniref:AcrR family transcriptional regulator n=1 Tax=Kutzneria viridogrisea TaxID=47990 RepID=A0ABR6BL72_9PSEU|nr:AcrR family transcriptional regulator [Kutzneria viridogrisea]
MTAESTNPQLGLRERKKLLAKQALERAAFELFEQKGFDATTVEDIAALAQVSRASFFRYFSAKEDVLANEDAQRRAAFMATLAARTDEPVLVVLRDAVHAHIAGMDVLERQRVLAYTRVMIGSRTLLGQAYEIRIQWLRELEPLLRERLAGRVDLEVLAPMLADVTMSVLETAMRLASINPELDFDEVIDSGFALLRPL